MSEVAQNGLGAQEQSEEISKSSEPINFLHHCPHCGSNKFEAHGTKEFICGACGFDFFVNSAAAVVALVTDEEGRLMPCARAMARSTGSARWFCGPRRGCRRCPKTRSARRVRSGGDCHALRLLVPQRVHFQPL